MAPAGYQEIDGGKNTRRWYAQRAIGAAAVVAIVVGLSLGLTDGGGGGSNKVKDIGAVAAAVSAQRLDGFLDDLQAVADGDGGGSRAVLTGHAASVEYVAARLAAATDLHVFRQSMQVPVWEQDATPTLELLSPMQVQFVAGLDFNQFSYGGDGADVDVTGAPFFAANDGCDAADYAGMDPAVIAVVPHAGACENHVKALLVESLGGLAVIIHHTLASGLTGIPGGRVRAADWQQGDALVTIPVLAATATVPQILAATTSSASVRITTSSHTVLATTDNICAETRNTGHRASSSSSSSSSAASASVDSKAHIVVVGAHLDSVPAGPGIDDDGSGTAALLELATLFAGNDGNAVAVDAENVVQFCWWAAEEIGLMGSRHYVRDLVANDAAYKDRIIANLNYDMLGSPNFVRYILDGATADDAAIVERSVFISDLHLRYFEDGLGGLTYHYLPFAFGRTDFVPFAENGIPAGGLFTGADGVKTAAERTLFGGFANAIHDTCYHQACDTIDNIDLPLLHNMTKAAAYVTEYLAVNSFRS